MAEMTTAARTTAPYDSGRNTSGVLGVLVSGAGTEQTEAVESVTDSEILIVGGHCTLAGAGTIEIYSDAVKIGVLEFAGADTKDLPKVWTEPGDSLDFKNPDGATAFISCDYCYATSGQYVGVL